MGVNYKYPGGFAGGVAQGLRDGISLVRLYNMAEAERKLNGISDKSMSEAKAKHNADAKGIIKEIPAVGAGADASTLEKQRVQAEPAEQSAAVHPFQSTQQYGGIANPASMGILSPYAQFGDLTGKTIIAPIGRSDASLGGASPTFSFSETDAYPWLDLAGAAMDASSKSATTSATKLPAMNGLAGYGNLNDFSAIQAANP